jgi:hypothetical protein
MQQGNEVSRIAFEVAVVPDGNGLLGRDPDSKGVLEVDCLFSHVLDTKRVSVA